MNTTTMLDKEIIVSGNNPGEQLAIIREQKGYSIEYVANKLHLRARIIELLESNQFNLLPEPVFVKGYLRAYAKLLGISADPYLAIFNEQYIFEKKPERALWQSKRESHKAEHAIRWFTVLFALGAVVAVSIWWQKNRDNQEIFSASTTSADFSNNQAQTTEIQLSDIKLTDLSKMQSLLAPKSEMSPVEKTGG